MTRPVAFAGLALWLVLATACASGPFSGSGGTSKGGVACEVGALPVASEADAICRARHWLALEPKPPGYEPVYAADLDQGVWVVQVSPDRGTPSSAGYVVEIDARSGELVEIRRGE